MWQAGKNIDLLCKHKWWSFVRFVCVNWKKRGKANLFKCQILKKKWLQNKENGKKTIKRIKISRENRSIVQTDQQYYYVVLLFLSHLLYETYYHIIKNQNKNPFLLLSIIFIDESSVFNQRICCKHFNISLNILLYYIIIYYYICVLRVYIWQISPLFLGSEIHYISRFT